MIYHRPLPPARDYFPGIGQAVADRTVNRKIKKSFDLPKQVNFSIPRDDAHSLDSQIAALAKSQSYVFEGDYHVEFGDDEVVKGFYWAVGEIVTEAWSDVAYRVSLGNAMLHPAHEGPWNPMDFAIPVPGQAPVALTREQREEFDQMHHHLRQASLLMSGRHLQHGDHTQKDRPMEVFTNCGHKDTQFVTVEHGVTTLGQHVGETVTVRCADGAWRPASVNAHGRQKLYRLTFQLATGHKIVREELFTRDHRWLLEDGTVTSHIQVGDVLLPMPEAHDLDPKAVVHGLVFGDGSAHKRRLDSDKPMVSQGRTYAMIRVCKQDAVKEEIAAWLTGGGYSASYPAHAKGDPVFYVGKFPFAKEVPFTTDPDYIAGFIHGWWLADGNKTEPSHVKVISTTDIEAAEWLKKHAVYAGLTVVSHRTVERTGEGCFDNGKPLHVIRLRAGVRWRLASINEVGEDDVFCVEEPVTHSFTLASQLVTGNCSSSAMSTILFKLLLSGSGVGRAYDDELMVVDYAQMPVVVCVIDWSHADVQSGEIAGYLTKRDAEHLYAKMPQTYFKVPDSREGWAKAVEQMEKMAFLKARDEVLILDFSDVRPKGAPIKGMQNRPASGPGPLMQALANVAKLRDAGMDPWRSTIYADHYLAECVLVGGARRAARMATKSWRDRTVFDFINLKRGGFLWSSNNSVTIDEEFRERVKKVFAWTERHPGADPLKARNFVGWPRFCTMDKHAWKVMSAILSASYHDGTGEPGLINVDMLTQKDVGYEVYADGVFAESELFQLDDETKALGKELLQRVMAMPHKHITNPCVTGDTWILTEEGPRQVSELIDKPFKAVVSGKSHQATGFWKTGEKKVFKVKTDRGYELRVTDNHKLLVEIERKSKFKRVEGKMQRDGFEVKTEWLEVKDIQPGDVLVLNDQSAATFAWGDQSWQSFEEGWLVGQIVGDGGYNPRKYPTYLRFWGEHKVDMSVAAGEIVKRLPFDRHRPVQLSNERAVGPNGTIDVSSRALDELCDGLIEPGTKALMPDLERKGSMFVRGFLRGFFDADGSVQGSTENGVSVRLAQSDLAKLKTVQRMLARLGIASSIYENRREAHARELPDGKGAMKLYECEAQHELTISKDNVARFQIVGFTDPGKKAKLETALAGRKRDLYKDRFTAEVVAIEEDGFEAVYDCTVDDVHCFDANGIIAHNCGEITLLVLGGYCVIADVVPFHAQDLDDAEDAFRVATRALIRTNLMDSLYKKEVQRTNRIGVGITGLHEFAWRFFQIGWRDMMSPNFNTALDLGWRDMVSFDALVRGNEDPHVRAAGFWLTLSRFKRAVDDEAWDYAHELGVEVPHTNTTIKPAGTTSKLFGLSEGAHLPALREYLRWVQYRNDDPLVAKLEAQGYPVRRLKTYSGTTVVGFPTAPAICRLGMGDKLVTAPEATPEEQFEYLRLLEKYWIVGVEEDGVTPLEETGNQVSYTLKYDPKVVGYEDFRKAIIEGQFTVRCASVMPSVDMTAYEYQPEEPVTKAQYEHILEAIKDDVAAQEDVDFAHVDCASGACPVDFDKAA